MKRRTFLSTMSLLAAAMVPPLDLNEPGVVKYTAKWTVAWWKKGDRARYRIQQRSRHSKSVEFERFDDDTDIHTLAFGRDAIRYDAVTRQAYKHTSHFRFGNPGGLGSNFDVTWLYEWWSKHTLAELLSGLDERGQTPVLAEEHLNGIRCVKLQYDLEKECEMVLWFAPDMSYSLVSGRFFHKNKPNLGSSYQASYKESSELKGVWLLNELELTDNQGLRNENLKVVFKDVNVGVSVPDEMFILEAIGIKKGTTIIDKRSEKPVDFAPPESATVNETIWTPFELNENVADAKGLVEAIETSYAARNQLLRYSTGSAEAEFERVYD